MRNPELGQKLLSIPKTVIYGLLILSAAFPLFFDVKLPNTPNAEVKDLFEYMTSLPAGSTVIIQSDWTESTKGENGGLMDALIRTLMRQRLKFAILSVADPQAPQVARNMVRKLNLELPEDKRYKKWEDWVELGFFPNAEGLGQSISVDIQRAFGERRDSGLNMPLTPVFQSPVLANIKKIEDVPLYVVVTGTQSIVTDIERFSKQTKIAGMVTGVMGPETLNYYTSHQLIGLAVGLKGTYDMETLMAQKPEYQGMRNLDVGPRYILSLHVAIGLLIAVVVIGNVGILLTRGKK